MPDHGVPPSDSPFPLPASDTSSPGPIGRAAERARVERAEAIEHAASAAAEAVRVAESTAETSLRSLLRLRHASRTLDAEAVRARKRVGDG